MSIDEQIREIVKSEKQFDNIVLSNLLSEFKQIKALLEERNTPYKHWGEHLSLKQAIEYTAKTRSCLDKWVKEGLLNKPYRIGGSTSTYYSKFEIDSIKPRWEAKKRNAQSNQLKAV